MRSLFSLMSTPHNADSPELLVLRSDTLLERREVLQRVGDVDHAEIGPLGKERFERGPIPLCSFNEGDGYYSAALLVDPVASKVGHALRTQLHSTHLRLKFRPAIHFVVLGRR
jgi:hypothetical protein